MVDNSVVRWPPRPGSIFEAEVQQDNLCRLHAASYTFEPQCHNALDKCVFRLFICLSFLYILSLTSTMLPPAIPTIPCIKITVPLQGVCMLVNVLLVIIKPELTRHHLCIFHDTLQCYHNENFLANHTCKKLMMKTMSLWWLPQWPLLNPLLTSGMSGGSVGLSGRHSLPFIAPPGSSDGLIGFVV